MTPRQITLNWLELNLWSKIPEAAYSQIPLLLSVRDLLHKIEAGKLKSLPANSLTEGEVRKMFGLAWSMNDPWSLDGREVQPVPTLLTQMLEVTHHALEDASGWEAPRSEAFVRVILNPILVCLISEEKTRANRQTISTAEPTIPQPTSSQTTPTLHASNRPTTPTQRKDLSLRFEAELKCPVTYKNEHRLLSGLADYSLWYPDDGDPSTNLIIVEAKKVGTSEAANGQLLAYMAIVHRTRKEQRKRNAVVYGTTTDGNLFRFFRIDNDGKISESRILEWKRGEGDLICSYIRYIIRAALASSPSTSPLKPDTAKEDGLASFGTEGDMFDYGISAYYEEDDPSALIDLPNLDL